MASPLPDSVQSHSAVPPIFVVHLPQEARRHDHMVEQLKSLPVRYELVEAAWGKDFSDSDLQRVYDKDQAKLYMHREMNPNEIACYLSHRKVMQRICDQNLAQAIILEDDVFISHDIVPFFENQHRFPRDWSIINLSAPRRGDHVFGWYPGSHKVFGQYRIGRPFPYQIGARGYLVSKAFCERFLANDGKIFIPIDQRLFNVLVSTEAFYTLRGTSLITHGRSVFGSTLQSWIANNPSHNPPPKDSKYIPSNQNNAFRIRRGNPHSIIWAIGAKVLRVSVAKAVRLLLLFSSPSPHCRKKMTPIFLRHNTIAMLGVLCANLMYSLPLRRFRKPPPLKNGSDFAQDNQHKKLSR